MKKQVYSNILILLITGILIKSLGLFNRIIITRLIGEEGVLIYALIMPTIMLILSISSFGFPLTISTLISNESKKYRNSQLIQTAIKISIIITITLIISLVILINPLASILNNEDIILPILCSIPLIPLVSFTSILKGYYNGQRRFKITSLSNLVEQLIRILSTITLIYIFIDKPIEIIVSIAILSLSIGELCSLIILIFKLKTRNMNLVKSYDQKSIGKDILKISLPITSSRLVGSLTFFFEPIIYTTCLLYIGIQQESINYVFSSVLGYALPLLSIASFISITICTATIPEISKFYNNKDYNSIHNILNKVFIFLCSVSIFFTTITFIFHKEIMQLLFNTTKGSEYIKILAIPFILIYFQPIFTTTLQTIGKAKEAFKTTLFISITKLILLAFLSFNIGLNSLIYAIIFSLLLNSLWHYLTMSNAIQYSISPFKIIFVILYFIFGISLTQLAYINHGLIQSIFTIMIVSSIPILGLFNYKK